MRLDLTWLVSPPVGHTSFNLVFQLFNIHQEERDQTLGRLSARLTDPFEDGSNTQTNTNTMADVWEDPLAITYPPLVEAALDKAFSLFGLARLTPHIHEVVLAFSLYHAIFLLSPIFLADFAPYKRLARRTQLNFDIHIVSSVQCILILVISFPAFWDPALQSDHIFAYSPYGGLVYAFAVGYFAWDSYISLKYLKWFGVGFAVHGLGSLCVFLLSFVSDHFLLLSKVSY